MTNYGSTTWAWETASRNPSGADLGYARDEWIGWEDDDRILFTTADGARSEPAIVAVDAEALVDLGDWE